MPEARPYLFWSSVNLTGNQTLATRTRMKYTFWSSVNLTGNQTYLGIENTNTGFGAVSI